MGSTTPNQQEVEIQDVTDRHATGINEQKKLTREISVPDPIPANPYVAIGGLGGSGTRVFAAVLRSVGIHIGTRLNDPLDNLWFTVLFKRAEWAQVIPPAAEVTQAADLFCRAMTVGLRDTVRPNEYEVLAGVRDTLPPNGTWHCGAGARDVDSLLASEPSSDAARQPWGWKEPNTHVFLPHLAQCFPEMRYVHVIRNGLDMAFSKNTWQVRNWGHLFGVTPHLDTVLPIQQLRYWIAANRVALDFGTAQMSDRFLILSYDAFCANPDNHWPRLRRFLDLPPYTTLPDNLLRPTTIGRSQDHDLSLLPPELLSAARHLQEEIATLSTSG
ncbi:hypothetical protein ACSSVY_000705 [Roseovarius sp. MBR-51]